MYKIGVAGYSGKPFDVVKGRELLVSAIDEALTGVNEQVAIVSGLTNIGIPKIAYQIATERGYRTVGVACKKATEYECFKVDEKIIFGEDWGDESASFLLQLDVLVRVGGGAQTFEEVAKAKRMGLRVVERDLDITK